MLVVNFIFYGSELLNILITIGITNKKPSQNLHQITELNFEMVNE